MTENNNISKHWQLKKLSKMWQLFGEKTDEIIKELSEALAA
jgi:hypothetical protein